VKLDSPVQAGASPGEPLVSVITIFLNPGGFFEESIRSVFDQTYAKWELLLVDDGSTDGSQELALDCARRNSGRVRYLSHPLRQNRGMSATRNLGIQQARGSLIAFLDSDDVWRSDRLLAHVKLLQANPAAHLVCGPTELWYGWAPGAARTDFVRELKIAANRVYEPPELLRLLPGDGVKTPATCSVLIRREAFEHAGFFEESFGGMYEDQAFFAKMFLHCRIYVTDLVLDRYRQHDGSCCAQAEKNKEYNPEGSSPAQKRFLQWLETYVSAQKFRDPVVSKALREALRPYRHPFLQRVRAWSRDPRGAAQRFWRRWRSREALGPKSGASSPAGGSSLMANPLPVGPFRADRTQHR
jgi:glycosyltransferase involved in cell wall biosynthesis